MDFLETLMRPQVQQGRNRPQYGVVTAKVTGRMDDGTYELSYLSMGDNEPSAPARMMMPTAGNRRGMYFFPEVGDEVIVAFESGDTNMPVILGAVYNEESPEPDQAEPSGENNVRTIVSRSGHEITLDDSPGREKVRIRTKGGHEVLLDDSPPGKITIRSARGSSLEMDDATLSMKLSAPVKIELEAVQIAIKRPSSNCRRQPESQLQTTGSAIASLVMIDGKPFGAHVHMPPIIPPAGTTGPVGP